MDGLADPKQLVKNMVSAHENTFTKVEVAYALSSELWGLVLPAQITRDVQALYDHALDRKRVPKAVLIELYLVRIYRQMRRAIDPHCKVGRDELLSFIAKFDAQVDSQAARWAFAEKVGGGEAHFEEHIIKKIKKQRATRQLAPKTINVFTI